MSFKHPQITVGKYFCITIMLPKTKMVFDEKLNINIEKAIEPLVYEKYYFIGVLRDKNGTVYNDWDNMKGCNPKKVTPLRFESEVAAKNYAAVVVQTDGVNIEPHPGNMKKVFKLNKLKSN